ncbi:MAG: hypothetical protein GXY79_05805, partial [Chloroflexi bacterium]|nr:hypothetical protein [Chloroflexota bacterium]
LGSDEQGQRVTIYRKGSSRRPEYPDLFLPLLGAFQLENACTAIATIEVLKEQGLPVPEDAVRSGLSSVQWPGRLQVLARNPLLVVDGAHNAYSLTQLIKSLPAYLDYQRLLLVFGAGRAHQPEGLLQVLLPAVDQAFLTQARHPKAESVANLVAIAQRQGTAAEGYPSSQEALQGALAAARPGDLILATGSLFLVAEIMSEWAALSGDEPYPSDPPGVY